MVQALGGRRLQAAADRTAKRKRVELRASELAMMLDGIDLRSVRRVKRYQRKKVTA